MKQEDIIFELMLEIAPNTTKEAASEVWSRFVNDAFENRYIEVTEDNWKAYQRITKNKEEFLNTITPIKVKQYNNILIYFLLWLVKIYQEQK